MKFVCSSEVCVQFWSSGFKALKLWSSEVCVLSHSPPDVKPQHSSWWLNLAQTFKILLAWLVNNQMFKNWFCSHKINDNSIMKNWNRKFKTINFWNWFRTLCWKNCSNDTRIPLKSKQIFMVKSLIYFTRYSGIGHFLFITGRVVSPCKNTSSGRTQLWHFSKAIGDMKFTVWGVRVFLFLWSACFTFATPESPISVRYWLFNSVLFGESSQCTLGVVCRKCISPLPTVMSKTQQASFS